MRREFWHRPVILVAVLLTASGMSGVAWAAPATYAPAQAMPSISAGAYLSCGIEAGLAYCWGMNGNGALGNGSDSNSDVPVAVDTSGVLAGKTLTQISAGDSFACALDSSGAAYCWGGNETGELGDGSAASSAVPVAVDTGGVLAGKTLTQISTGLDDACALDSSGAAYCWGINNYGQLGNGTTVDSDVPVAVDTSGVLAGKTLTQISAGGEHACALDTSGRPTAGATTTYGDLGNGSTTD